MVGAVPWVRQAGQPSGGPGSHQAYHQVGQGAGQGAYRLRMMNRSDEIWYCQHHQPHKVYSVLSWGLSLCKASYSTQLNSN